VGFGVEDGVRVLRADEGLSEAAGGGEDAGEAQEVQGEAAAVVAGGELVKECVKGGGEEAAGAID